MGPIRLCRQLPRNACDVQDAGWLAAAAGTVDASGVDRVGQQSYEVSANHLLSVTSNFGLKRLQTKEALEHKQELD